MTAWKFPQPQPTEMRRAARARWNITDQDLLLGCVGYLLPEKGQDTLLRALPQIRAQFPNCRIILAGDGPCRVKLQSLARELGIVDAVIFAGFVEDVEAVYRALDLFVFPSLAEPLGSSLLTAMAHGLPVIAVASGGVPEIIENGRNGILVDSPDALKFAASACQMLKIVMGLLAWQKQRERPSSTVSPRNYWRKTLYSNIKQFSQHTKSSDNA